MGDGEDELDPTRDMAWRPQETFQQPPLFLLFLKSTSSLLSISSFFLSFIHVPAAPHTGLGKHRQPLLYSGSSRGTSCPDSRFLWTLPAPPPPVHPECAQGPNTQMAPGRIFLSLRIMPRSHSHEEERVRGLALWGTRVVTWQY